MRNPKIRIRFFKVRQISFAGEVRLDKTWGRPVLERGIFWCVKRKVAMFWWKNWKKDTSSKAKVYSKVIGRHDAEQINLAYNRSKLRVLMNVATNFMFPQGT